MACVNGNYTSFECKNCSFWKPHKLEGTCSQLVKTSDGLVKQITRESYLCSMHTENPTYPILQISIMNDGEGTISSAYSHASLLKAQRFVEERLLKYRQDNSKDK